MEKAQVHQDIQAKLRKHGDKERARVLGRFFKTGPGEYGEGDVFLGVKVPEIRKIAGEYRYIHLPQVRKLLRSPIHEERLVALLILVMKFSEGTGKEQKRIYDLYLKSSLYINNWDLVDLSAEKIVGAYLMERDRTPLYKLARSDVLWERRIAIMSTFYYIKQHDFSETLGIAEELLLDREDLIHKAVGWMLREVGKRNLRTAEIFLRKHYREMPRTMLRYAIERYPETRRQKYLKGTI